MCLECGRRASLEGGWSHIHARDLAKELRDLHYLTVSLRHFVAALPPIYLPLFAPDIPPNYLIPFSCKTISPVAHLHRESVFLPFPSLDSSPPSFINIPTLYDTRHTSTRENSRELAAHPYIHTQRTIMQISSTSPFLLHPNLSRILPSP